MRRLLDFLRPRKAPAPFNAALAPERPVAVIGDVHGRDDLLGRLLGMLEDRAPDHTVVLVGDLIDRGEESAAVLRRLQGRPDLLCLKGNHEAMCLEFLDEPEIFGPRWLGNGGLQTLASFGVRGFAAPEALRRARDGLALAMGDELIDWMRGRPLTWRTGNIVVTHAGADPLRPMEEQVEEQLLWGAPGFGSVPRRDGLWIAHGHVIRSGPRAEGGRIAVDTGAYATGRLTAALIAPGKVEFVST